MKDDDDDFEDWLIAREECIMDLDDEELEATRKLNGADKTSNIEEDIKNIKQYINLVLDKGYCDCNELNVISTGKYCDGSKNVAYSMQNILAEREQKDKRIKELEEENAHFKLENLKLENLNKTLNFNIKNSIPVQKVIDRINYCDERIKHAKQIRDKEQEEFYIDLKRAFNKLLEEE